MKYVLLALVLISSNAKADWCQDLLKIYDKASYYYDKKVPLERVFDNVLNNYHGGEEALTIILNTITSAYRDKNNGYAKELGHDLLINECRYEFSEGK